MIKVEKIKRRIILFLFKIKILILLEENNIQEMDVNVS